MTEPSFTDGRDETTFAPFILHDWRDSEFHDLRLEFNDWDALEMTVGEGYPYVGDYYLNGPGVQGLVFAARIVAGLDPMPAGVEPDSEAGACYMHFGDLETAVETAKLAQSMITDRAKIQKCAQVAVEEGLDDF